LKLAQINASGQLIDVRQLPCPIWRGIEYLDRALEEASHAIQAKRTCHALTMTAELADIFTDRLQGMQVLIEHFGAHVSVGRIRIFAGKAGWLATAEVKEHATSIASANWLASASYAARKCARGIVVDIGSTTTDIIEFRDGRIWYRGYSDGERLRTGELVYTGVLRTPVMAVVQWVPFEGEWQTLASEQFATLADVYQLTGQLAAAVFGCVNLPPNWVVSISTSLSL
jgi:probable H4MPT-linked C1 transfer pathway protein